MQLRNVHTTLPRSAAHSRGLRGRDLETSRKARSATTRFGHSNETKAISPAQRKQAEKKVLDKKYFELPGMNFEDAVIIGGGAVVGSTVLNAVKNALPRWSSFVPQIFRQPLQKTEVPFHSDYPTEVAQALEDLKGAGLLEAKGNGYIITDRGYTAHRHTGYGTGNGYDDAKYWGS